MKEAFGEVEFNRKELTIDIRTPQHSYYIDLTRAKTPAAVLDWLFQILQKSWVTPEIFFDVANTLDDACQQVFGPGMTVQGCFCSDGRATAVDWRKGALLGPVVG